MRRRLSLGVLATLGLTCSRLAAAETTAPDPQLADELFERHEIVLGASDRQTVLAGILLGNEWADLAVVRVAENGDRHLAIYEHVDGSWAESLGATLRPDVLFVDVLSFEGRERLIWYEHPGSSSGGSPGRLSWFDPGSASGNELVAVSSSFRPPRQDEIPHVDLTRDINGDGRDDLIVPDHDGFWLFTQTSGGGFSDPVLLRAATDLSGILGADGYRYDPWSVSRIQPVDMNADGRPDLVYWNEGQFEIHLQDEQGQFGPDTETLSTELELDSDDFLSLATGDLSGRVLHSLSDVNGDGIPDVVAYSLQGLRIADKSSAYEVHFGRRPRLSGPSATESPSANVDIVFAAEVGARLRSEGRIQLRMEPWDLGEGRTAWMLPTIERRFLQGSLWKKIKGAMGDDVVLSVEFHQLGDGVFDEKPKATRRIALDGVPSHREPGWVPLDIVLRGSTHLRRRTEST